MANNQVFFKRSAVPGKKPLANNINLGQLAINTYDGRLYTKRAYLDENNDPAEAIVEFVGKVSVGNTFFVSKNGSDLNDGLSWDTAFATIEKALTEADARNGLLTLIDIGPGEYETEGHLDLPDNCMIRAVHRTVIVKPKTGFAQRNVFRMGSGCFIEGPLFEGWQLNSLDNPTEGFAISFRPGAVITRAPYAHKIAIRTPPTWSYIAPPLDAANANPLVPVGAGVVLADGAICSPYSIYPNIMTWGATPVSHNGIGYLAKNGALINAVNAVSLWCHKHFVAANGGQIILSSCSTQFGDYTLVADGSRNLLYPEEANTTLTVQTVAANAINNSRSTIINNLWGNLVSQGYTTTWNAEDEVYTRRDANTFLQCMLWTLQTANEKPMLDFAKGLFDYNGNTVFTTDKTAAFIYSFEFMRDEIQALADVNANADVIVANLVTALTTSINTPTLRIEPSIITAIGHTFTGVMAGVALTKIPPAKNEASIQDSILELNNGNVIASGQDDQGNAIFVGGLEINADTGELGGPPFEQAVNRIATRTAISRSF
jgi:dihydroxyacetone kinase DhaKLM complex PTS-EIIA-like component DhaM